MLTEIYELLQDVCGDSKLDHIKISRLVQGFHLDQNHTEDKETLAG
jgi:hypothetical protein